MRVRVNTSIEIDGQVVSETITTKEVTELLDARRLRNEAIGALNDLADPYLLRLATT